MGGGEAGALFLLGLFVASPRHVKFIMAYTFFFSF